MKTTIVALTLSTLTVFGAFTPVLAQSAKVVRGTVASMGAQSLTVTVGDRDMTFAVDGKTMVEARGGSTKSAQAAAAGKAGPHLDELLKNGQPVAVTYSDKAGVLHATTIKAIAKASTSTASADATKISEGVVKAMGPDWITINGKAGSGATFEQTFKIGTRTKVFAKGAGTAAAATGGKVVFHDIVTSGDHVSVSYHVQGDSLLASNVHVTTKASH